MKDNKVLKFLNRFFSIIGLIVFLLIAVLFVSNASGVSSLLTVVGLIKAESLYESDSTHMLEGATAGVVASLEDPYSRYLSKKQWDELRLNINAEFGGIGVYVVQMKSGELVIYSPIEGTPAQEAGLEHGDIIIRLNGESTINMSQDDAVNQMRGEPGTQLEIGVLRKSDGKEHNFTIIREIINVPSVANEMLDEAPGIGYVWLSQVHSHSAKEIADALNKLKAEDMEGLILDLRDNGGGDFQAAIQIADIFLDNKVIVSTRNTRGAVEEYDARSGSYNVPMVILVNQNTASAAEILAGALQDNERAVLIGQKTYGKGLVQKVYPLPDGGALKLTTQKYFTPDGTDINEIGINPDYVVELSDKDNKDHQLERAIEILKQQLY